VKRCALAIVQRAEGYFVFEIQEHVDFVVLGCQVERVESGFGFGINVSSLLVKVFYSLQVSHVCCVQERSEPFFVLFIEPLDDLLLVVFLVNLFQTFLSLGLSPVQFYRVMDVKLDHIQVVFVCQFVQDVIVRFVRDLTWINVLVLS
jgi:hypothetical protein